MVVPAYLNMGFSYFLFSIETTVAPRGRPFPSSQFVPRKVCTTKAVSQRRTCPTGVTCTNRKIPNQQGCYHVRCLIVIYTTRGFSPDDVLQSSKGA